MRSYLIYEKRTEAQLPVALFYSQADVARFLGLSWLQVHRIVIGCTQNPYYGIFVDDFDPAEEGRAGQMYCDRSRRHREVRGEMLPLANKKRLRFPRLQIRLGVD